MKFSYFILSFVMAPMVVTVEDSFAQVPEEPLSLTQKETTETSVMSEIGCIGLSRDDTQHLVRPGYKAFTRRVNSEPFLAKFIDTPNPMFLGLRFRR